MLPPLIQRPRRSTPHRTRERGVTMALVALAMVAVIAMAALSIDLGTLYEAKAEAQRAADLGALAAARIISIQGVTGDPTSGTVDGSWVDICGGTSSPASLAAINVAQQNLINGAAASTVHVYYGTSAGVGTNTNCISAGANFGVNPVVQVYVQQATLPSFFARVFSLVMPGGTANSGVSATATAEVFNPSYSGTQASGMIPVQPRCVKPWIIPNIDPGNSSNPFLNPDGTIVNPGVQQLGPGVIGETFTINADCLAGAPNCEPPPVGNLLNNPPKYIGGILQYVPALVAGTPTAVPSCSASTGFQPAIAGCDQTTVYTCGTPSASSGATQIDLTENPLNPPGTAGDSPTAAMCLINNAAGRDTLAGTLTVPTYPFQIQAGFGNPLVQAGVGVSTNDIITVSNSVVTLPIYDGNGVTPLGAGNQPPVTIIGFLQVFINIVNPDGSMGITVLNVAGCSSSAAGNPTVTGTSPVPIRLITPP
jgi:putative Flp pilus-assembly TadE/G-like protein